jgi:hypothetical protein
MGNLHHVEGSQTCARCPNIKTGLMSGQDLLKHMGTHILNDASLRGAEDPCGLCLNTGGLCEIYLQQRSDTISVDQKKSRCPNLRPFQIKKAEEFTVRQPCTNHPMFCPHCPRGGPAVWKYNLRTHLQTKHASFNPNLQEPLYRFHPDEEQLMKAEWEKLKRHRNRPSKESSSRKLKISDGHSSRLALR